MPDGDEKDFNVNSDGSPRAYHLLDPQGVKYAINDMTSGGVRVFDENGQQIRLDGSGPEGSKEKAKAHYYEIFARFVAENDNFGVTASNYDPRKDSAYQLGDDFGNKLDPPPKTALEFLRNKLAAHIDLSGLAGWLSEVLAPSPASRVTLSGFTCLPCKVTTCRVCFPNDIIKSDSGRLCIRKTGRYAGFLVNQTGLDSRAGNKADPENSEDATCGVVSNLDPEKLPGIVLPGGTLAPDEFPDLKAASGDIVVGYNPQTGKWAFGIVSDSGPAGKFGEASIAFNRILSLGYGVGSTFPRPRNYRGDLLTRVYAPPRPIALLLLPGTADRLKTLPNPKHQHEFDYSPANVAATAKTAFLEWAGVSDLESARAKFLQCLGSLP
jgi:hypothetical protein